MLLASKKALTGKWLTTDIPIVEGWLKVIHVIGDGETSFILRLKQEKFKNCWPSWVESMSLRSDFTRET